MSGSTSQQDYIYCSLEIQTELTQRLKEFVAIPSVNPPGHEQRAVDFMEKLMISYGLEVKRVHVADPGRDCLIAQIAGKEPGDGVIFTGHMDVVPVSDAEYERWETNPFIPEIKDGYLHGRGSSDMKSGVISAVLAACHLKKEGIVPPRDIALVLTIDEEDGMLGSRALIGHEALAGYKWVVVCEPTQLECCTISRGRTYGELKIQGQTAHGSRPGSGKNAILLSVEFIDQMMAVDMSEYANEFGATFWQPLSIHAGVEPCVVPDICTVKIDARLTLGHDPDDIWKEVDQIIADLTRKHGSETMSVSYEVIDKREPWKTSSDCWLVRSAQKALESCGVSFVETMFSGTTDGTPLRRDGREAIILGPGDLSCVHQENERVLLSEVYRAFDIYSTMMRAPLGDLRAQK